MSLSAAPSVVSASASGNSSPASDDVRDRPPPERQARSNVRLPEFEPRPGPQGPPDGGAPLLAG